jgi:hypothetical protein
MAAKSSSENPGISKKTMSSLMGRTLQPDLITDCRKIINQGRIFIVYPGTGIVKLAGR